MRVQFKVDHRLHIPEPWTQPVVPELVHLTGQLDEERATEFRRDLEVAECNARIAGQEILPICIDTYGGDAYAMMSCIDAMDACQIKLATIVEGKAMSAGAIIFSCGADGFRFMGPNATLMIHSASGGVEGHADAVLSEARELERLNNMGLERFALNCGHPKRFFIEYIKQTGNTELYIPARQCKKLGIANHLKIPMLLIEISASNKLIF